MIPTLLQDCLVDELKNLFSGFTLKNVKGEESPLNIYPQGLPAIKGQKDTKHYPFVVVKLQDGEDPDRDAPYTCRIMFFCGIYDDADNYQGHKDLLNVMQKIYAHIMRKRLFAGKYEAQYPITWALTEEDLYPQYYGAVESTWAVGKVTMQDDEFV